MLSAQGSPARFLSRPDGHCNLQCVSFKCRNPIIDGTAFTYLDEGAYGVIFADTSLQRVRKCFYRSQRDLAHSTRVFWSEVKAYEIAMNRAKLHTLVPEFFGIVPTQIILDKCRNDISDEFFPLLAFETALVSQDFVKLRTVNDVERERIVELFTSEGINYLEDASVLLQRNCVVKVIDFAVEGFQLDQC